MEGPAVPPHFSLPSCRAAAVSIISPCHRLALRVVRFRIPYFSLFVRSYPGGTIYPYPGIPVRVPLGPVLQAACWMKTAVVVVQTFKLQVRGGPLMH